MCKLTVKAVQRLLLVVLFLVLSIAVQCFGTSLAMASTFRFATTTNDVAESTTVPTSTTEATFTEGMVLRSASSTVFGGIAFEKNDITQPEELSEKEQIRTLISERPAETLTLFNFFAFWIQKAIAVGIPANTIVLILLIPVFATIVTFVRTVIGLPSLEMLVPIVLAYVFVAVGVTTSLVLLLAIILAAFVSRRLLSSVQVMFFAKRSISLMFLAFFVLAALTLVSMYDPNGIVNLSIFPLLVLTLMGDSIVAVHLHKSIKETFLTVTVTIVLGFVGYVLATAVPVRDTIILYPEVVLLTLIANGFIGRYFGLRLTEFVRFKSFKAYGSK